MRDASEQGDADFRTPDSESSASTTDSQTDGSGDSPTTTRSTSTDGELDDPYEDLTIETGAVVEPGTSLVNETGSWREKRPVIHHEPCTGCGLCVTFCPDGAVERVDDLAEAVGHLPGDRQPVPRAAKHVGEQQVEIDYRYCKGCGICATECPIDAISMVTEVK